MCINRKVSLVFVAFVAIFFVYSFQYPKEIVMFPRFLLALLFLLAVILFIRPGDLGKVKVTEFLTKPKLVTSGCMLLYVVAFPWLGFFVTTFLTVFGYILYFERSARLKGFLIAASWVVILFVAFQTFLYIWFPKGLLI